MRRCATRSPPCARASPILRRATPASRSKARCSTSDSDSTNATHALNTEALKPIEDMLHEVRDALRRQNPQPAAVGVARDLGALNQKIDALAWTSVEPELLDQIRRQTEDIRRQLTAAASHSAPLTRIERKIEQLADRVERLATHPVPQTEIDTLARALNETRKQIEQATPPSALASIAQRLAALTSRIDDALRRATAAPAARPLEELTRRVDAVRASLDQRGDVASHTRIEDLAARPAAPQTLDAAPFRDLARRIDAVRVSLEQRGDFAEQARRVETALAGMRDTIERSFNPAQANAAVSSTLQQLVGRLDDLVDRPPAGGAFDPAPFHDLALRIDAVRAAIEQRGGFAGEAAGLENKLAELSDKLDDSLRAASANEGVNANLQRIVARLEGIARQSGLTGSADLGAVRDLASRIDGLRTAMDRQAGFGPQLESLASDVQEIRGRLETPRIGAPEAKQIIDAIQNLANRPPPNAAINLAPFHELARRIDAVRSAMDRQTDPGPQLASLASEVEEIRGRLETSQIGAPEAKQIIDAIQSLADRPPASAAVDLAPFRELARRIDAVRSTMDRQTDPARSSHPSRARSKRSAPGWRLARSARRRRSRSSTPSKTSPIGRPPAPPSTSLRSTSWRGESRPCARRWTARPTSARSSHPWRAEVEVIRARLESSPIGAPDTKQIIDAIQNLADRPPASAAADLAPFHDLARRVDAVRVAVEDRHSDRTRSSNPCSPSSKKFGGLWAAPRWLTPDTQQIIDAIQNLAYRPPAAAPSTSAPCAIWPRRSTLCAPPLSSAAVSRAKRRPSKRSSPRWATNSTILCAPCQRTEHQCEFAARPGAARGDRASAGVRGTRPTLGALHDLVSQVESLRSAMDWQADLRPELASLASGVEEIRGRLDTAPIGAAEVKALIDVIQDLAERVDRQTAAPDLSADEEMARQIASHSAAVDLSDVRALLSDVSEKIEAGARFDSDALTDWMNRLEEKLQGADMSGVERALRDLESRLASREYLSLDPRQLEAAADLIAQRLGPQNGLGAEAEMMFGQIADIERRLEALSGVSESNAALERTIGDLMAVFESTRAAFAVRADDGARRRGRPGRRPGRAQGGTSQRRPPNGPAPQPRARNPRGAHRQIAPARRRSRRRARRVPACRSRRQGPPLRPRSTSPKYRTAPPPPLRRRRRRQRQTRRPPNRRLPISCSSRVRARRVRARPKTK